MFSLIKRPAQVISQMLEGRALGGARWARMDAVGLKGINKVTEGNKLVCALQKAREKFEDPHKG